ncbi:hypothetical protein [Paralcaligenes ginsengisoli]
MRGQNAIIRMRLDGYKPAFVFVDALDHPCEESYFRDAENNLMNGGQALIHIGSDDQVPTLDLRAVAGTTVVLNGTDRDRLRGIYAQLKKFKPSRIVASTPDFVFDSQEKMA